MGWPEHYIKIFKKNPPEKEWPAIRTIRLLPKSYLGVIRDISGRAKVMGIFDPTGRWEVTIKESEIVSDIVSLFFFSDRVGIILKGKDTDVYREFKVKNLPHIYRN